jgi:hypothetical protein
MAETGCGRLDYPSFRPKIPRAAAVSQVALTLQKSKAHLTKSPPPLGRVFLLVGQSPQLRIAQNSDALTLLRDWTSRS